MFKPGHLYRFNVNRDVAFEVHKAFYVKEKKLWKLTIGWYNIGHCHAPWPMGIQQKLALTSDKLKDVSELTFGFRVPAAEYTPVYY